MMHASSLSLCECISFLLYMNNGIIFNKIESLSPLFPLFVIMGSVNSRHFTDSRLDLCEALTFFSGQIRLIASGKGFFMPQTPFPWFSGIIGRRLLDQSCGPILFRRHPVCTYRTRYYVLYVLRTSCTLVRCTSRTMYYVPRTL